MALTVSHAEVRQRTDLVWECHEYDAQSWKATPALLETAPEAELDSADRDFWLGRLLCLVRALHLRPVGAEKTGSTTSLQTLRRRRNHSLLAIELVVSLQSVVLAAVATVVSNEMRTLYVLTPL